MYYASFGMLAMIMHVIVNADILFGHVKSGNTIRGRYRAFLYSIMIYYLSDILWGFLHELRIVPLVYSDTVLYFLAMGLTLYMWIRFIIGYINKNGILSKILNIIGLSLFALETIALAVNFFIPIFFYFEDDGEYVTRPARYTVLIAQIVLFAIIGVITLFRAFKHTNRDKLHYNAIGISSIVMALFVGLQAMFPLLPFYAIGCLLGTSIINTYVGVDERTASSHQLGSMKQVAYKDPLTSVRNINAYAETKRDLEHKIDTGMLHEFGIAVFDLNDLKKVNDTKGHEAGDRYILDGCWLICHVFDHSPVFRIGGDEFVAILMNSDYRNRDSLLAHFNEEIEYNKANDGVVVSAGISVFDPDTDSSFDAVFARADELMYAHKRELKGTDHIRYRGTPPA